MLWEFVLIMAYLWTGKGQYGDVFLAKAHGIRDGEAETLVAVKSLLTRDEHHLFEFRREMDMFYKLNHENITKLLGVCRDMEPHFLIIEYCDWVSIIECYAQCCMFILDNELCISQFKVTVCTLKSLHKTCL